ncbi:MAG TPA: C4-type zinc ribbon domain-containing protein [Polyangiaceae bacterium]
MTIQAQIDTLERLAALDSELHVLKEELQTERQELGSKKSHIRELDEKLARDRGSVDDMERMRGDLVGEVRQMSVQVEKSREKLSRCRTEREANAAQRELEELRKLYRDREIEIEKLVGLVEQARVDIAKAESEHRSLASELSEQEGPLVVRLREVEKEIALREAARKELVQAVPVALYRKYELVRKRRGTALAHTVEGTCSACHIALPPMLFQQVRRGLEFAQCPSCHRILYFREVAALQADSQSSGA